MYKKHVAKCQNELEEIGNKRAKKLEDMNVLKMEISKMQEEIEKEENVFQTNAQEVNRLHGQLEKIEHDINQCNQQQARLEMHIAAVEEKFANAQNSKDSYLAEI